VVPLRFFIEVAAVLGFRVGSVRGVAAGTRVQVSVVHELKPAPRALLLVFWPDCVAIWATVRFVFNHAGLLRFAQLYAHNSYLYRDWR